MNLFAIQLKVSYLLNTFASNKTFLILKSKSFTPTTNQAFVIRTIVIVQKKESRT
jgi:hypothetical protein